MSVDYRGIGASIVSHLQSELSGDYLITQNISEALSQTAYKVAAVVTFSGLVYDEARGLVPDTPARTGEYIIGVIARGESDEQQDELIDTAVSEIEAACNVPNSGYPIFDEEDIEWAYMSTVSKVIDTQMGITASMKLVCRIMEG